MSDIDNSQAIEKWFFLSALRGLIPGLAVAAIIAAAALSLSKLTIVINDFIIAILIGAVIRNSIGIQDVYKPGLSFSLKIGQKLGLNKEISVLLGVGSAICGATAVLAAGPAIKAKERDIACEF